MHVALIHENRWNESYYMEKNRRTDPRPLVECGTKGHRRPSPGDPFQWVTSRECVRVLGAHFHGFFSRFSYGLRLRTFKPGEMWGMLQI